MEQLLRMTAPLAHTGYRYSVYGVRVTSDMSFDFPAARETDTPLAEVEFVGCTESDFPASGHVPDLGAQALFECRLLPDGSTYVRWSDLYAFHIEPDGLRVSCRQLARGHHGVLQNFLFGQALSFALVRQGLEQLHAAVVGIEDAAIGFLGDCTFGKSTLAASFVRAGHRLLTDDLLMIDRRTDAPIALPGSGRIKLEPDSALALLSDTTRGVLLNPDSSKRSFPLTEDCVQRTGLPLTRLFVLPSPDERDDITEIEIRPLSRTGMFKELLKSSFNIKTFDRPRLEKHFEFAAALASDVEGLTLRYPRGLHHLREVREAVVEHVHRTVGKSDIAVAGGRHSCESHRP
jgi:hypothetical protein